MTLPDKYFSLLQRQIEQHDERIALLRVAIQEIELHEAVVRVARDEALLDAFADCRIQMLGGTDATKNFARYCINRNVASAEELGEIEWKTDESALHMRIVLRVGQSVAQITWTEEMGFRAIPASDNFARPNYIVTQGSLPYRKGDEDGS